MTKNERAVVQGFINKINDLEKVREATLEALKDMNELHGDGHRWCSWEACLEGLASRLDPEHVVYRRAKYEYDRFVKASAQIDLIREFGGDLADIGFWK